MNNQLDNENSSKFNGNQTCQLSKNTQRLYANTPAIFLIQVGIQRIFWRLVSIFANMIPFF